MRFCAVGLAAAWLPPGCGVGPPASQPASTFPAAVVPTSAAATSTDGTTFVLGMHERPDGLHQAPELEALLPDVVAGRELARSRRSRAGVGSTSSSARSRAESTGSSRASDTPIDLEHINYAVAGRSNTTKDPPYFVNAASRPLDENEIDLNLALLLGGGGFLDLAAGFELEGFEMRTIGGKEVFVGTDEMLEQNRHQRGRPYLYQTDDTMFLVITDDDAWAREALGKIP